MDKKIITDATFGTLIHVVGNVWQRPIDFYFFNSKSSLSLMVDVSPKNGIESNQISAFHYFIEHSKSVATSAEQAILRYYQSVCDRYRSQYGVVDPDDARMPVVKSKTALSRLIHPEGITFPYVRRCPTFGILCKCSWEEERGLAVKFEDGKLTDVGFQDIVL